MTINEAIAKYKEIANTDANCPAHCNISCDKCVQESGQIAGWLEELKAYRTLDKTNFSDGYNRAIDDFLKKALTFEDITGCVDSYKLENIAEQLKVGGNHE